MIEAVLVMLGLGAACASMLTVASKVFYVYEDPRIAEVEGLLAGANCGGCGFPGCSGAAAAVVGGKAAPGVCVVAGLETAIQVAAVMGIDPGTVEPLKVFEHLFGRQPRGRQVLLFRSQQLPRTVRAVWREA